MNLMTLSVNRASCLIKYETVLYAVCACVEKQSSAVDADV